MNFRILVFLFETVFEIRILGILFYSKPSIKCMIISNLTSGDHAFKLHIVWINEGFNNF